MSPISPLRIAGVPEHFNLPWRQRAWLSATQPDRYTPIDYREAAAGTGAMVAALNEDKVDLAILLTEGAIRDIARGGRHRVIKVYVGTPLEWGIHVAANGNLHSVASIKGQRYAISRRGSGSHIMAVVHAAAQHWPIDTLRFVQVDTLAGARRALPANEADVFFWEKTMTHPYVKSGEFRRVGVFASPWPSFVVCASNSILQRAPHQVHQLMKQINVIARRFMQNQDAPQLISNAYGITPLAASTWLSQTTWDTSMKVPTQTLQRVLDHLRSLDSSVALTDAHDLIHPLEKLT